jgi:predicted AlkP superfamily pyrophosphatase or phosphodiesterase
MKFALRGGWVALVVCLLVGSVLTAAEPRKDRCVILVSVDGLAEFYVDDPRADMPTLRRMASKGAKADGMVGSFPTVTWPAHTSMVTGVQPGRHGVIGNSYFDRETQKTVTLLCDPVFDKDETVRVPTIYDAAHKAGLKTAAVCWPATRNAKTLDWTVPDMAGDSWDKYGTKSWLDELRAAGWPVDKQGVWCTEPVGGVERDWLYARMTRHVLQKHAPNLILVHLVEPDHVQHRTGPRSDDAYWCASYADDRIRDILEAIEQSSFKGKATLIVVGDHGFFPVQNELRPNVALRKLGLIEMSGNTISKRAAYCVSQGGGCAVYVLDAQKKAEIIAQLKGELAKIDGVQAVLDEPAYKQLGHTTPDKEPRAPDMWLAAKSGYAFSESAAGDETTVAKKTVTGTHGYLPDQPDMRSACVLWGAGVKPGTKLGKVSIIDLAPTIARLLSVDFPSADGKPMADIGQ